MPLHQHHHGNHLCHQVSGNPSCCSPCCCSCSCNSSSSSPLPPIPSDQLVQAMAAAQILQTQSLLRPQQIPKDHHHTQSLLHTLIRRVAALETSLSAAPPPLPPSPPRRRRPSPPPPSPSLREVAARTIQARFRRFQVRRSQTLRDLKRIASIKSNVEALRWTVSRDAGAEPEAVSQKAMDLLLQLDSIQSFDPMIRDGKRSISSELARMLDFVDKVLVRERRFPIREALEEKAAPPLPRARSAKRVSFAEHGGALEDKDVLSRVLEEEEEELGYGNGAIFHGQNGGFGLSAPPLPRARSAKKVSFSEHVGAVEDKDVLSRVMEEEGEGLGYGNGAIFHGQNGGFGLSAPLPVQMRPRVGF